MGGFHHAPAATRSFQAGLVMCVLLSPLTVRPYKHDALSAWRETLGSARGVGSQGRPGRERRWSWLKEVQLGFTLTWAPSLPVPWDREHPRGWLPLPLPGYLSQLQGATPSVPHCTSASAGTHHLGIRVQLVAPRRQRMPGTHSRSSERKLTA